MLVDAVTCHVGDSYAVAYGRKSPIWHATAYASTRRFWEVGGEKPLNLHVLTAHQSVNFGASGKQRALVFSADTRINLRAA